MQTSTAKELFNLKKKKKTSDNSPGKQAAENVKMTYTTKIQKFSKKKGNISSQNNPLTKDPR